MEIFVTGATGLVGRALCDALVRRGDRVACVTRGPLRARSVLPAGVDVVEGDPTVPGPWRERLASADAAVNLAGESVAGGRWTLRRKREIRRSRLETTRNVAAALGRAPAGRTLVSASAVGYYGDGGDAPLGEDSGPGDDFLGRLAHEWEAATLPAERAGVRVVKVRVGVVLAADGGALPRMALPFRFFAGGPLGSGRQYLPWIHIRDLVAVLLFALDTPELEGPVNAVAPDPPRQRDFARALGRALGRPSWLPAPEWALRLALGEMAGMLLAGQRAVPKALRAHGFSFDYNELNAALRDLL